MKPQETREFSDLLADLIRALALANATASSDLDLHEAATNLQSFLASQNV